MIKYIHVNQAIIKHNIKYGTNLPVVRVQYGRSGKSKYCKSVNIKGASELAPNFENPLKCGAKIWIASSGDVELIGEVPYSKLKEQMSKHRNG